MTYWFLKSRAQTPTVLAESTMPQLKITKKNCNQNDQLSARESQGVGLS